MTDHEIIISGSHMDLTEALKNMVEEKAAKLFRHEEQIVRLRVELGSAENKKGADEYTAKGHIEIRGPDLHASATTEDLYKSIDEMVEKLDRQIRKRSRHEMAKRNNPHDVEIPAAIPKTG